MELMKATSTKLFLAFVKIWAFSRDFFVRVGQRFDKVLISEQVVVVV